MIMQKVKAVTDDSGHWYIIPNELYEEFRKDYMDDFYGSCVVPFDDKWGKYRTGGDLNLVQLWAEI